MISIKLYRDNNAYMISVKGHAGYKPQYDPVCAAVSTLTFTLAETLTYYDDLLSIRSDSLDFGNASIVFKPKMGNEASAEMIAKTFLIGFTMIENKYPECIKMDVLGW